MQNGPSMRLCAYMLSDVQKCGEWRQVAQGSSAASTEEMFFSTSTAADQGLLFGITVLE